jgi:hypothetical protein
LTSRLIVVCSTAIEKSASLPFLFHLVCVFALLSSMAVPVSVPVCFSFSGSFPSDANCSSRLGVLQVGRQFHRHR